ncbi:MAG: hypothetical protein Q9177_005908, partial [Variospora cf. flavescens]
MAPNIFVTGATGYIGGDALYELMKRHSSDYQVAALVRDSDKGAQVASQYPNIRLVYGDLDSAETLHKEAKKADVVLHCASADHVVAAEALTSGLAAHAPESPGYIIHTSGTGILMFADMERQIFGESSSKIFDDWEGVGEVTSIPDFAPHRDVDKIILAASSANVKPAIVCPPTIYGPGRGPGNQRSIQVPELSRCTLQKGHGIQVGAGKTFWTNVHVNDLSHVFVALVEAAVAGGGKASWGNEGYYFTENGEHVWGDIARLVAGAAHKQGFIASSEVKILPNEEIEGLCKAGTLLWGANSRCRAVRARNLLGWSPKGISLERDIADTVAAEANLRGLVQHHAAKVAGGENPMESYTGNVYRQVPDHNVSPGFRFPQKSPPQGESVAGASPLGRRKMKHLTCWYWHDKGDCVYPEDRCLYTHSYVGTQRIADAPVQKQPGMPAVAGRNALQAYPVYSDWTANRGLSAHDPRRSMHVTSPETLQDPIQVKTEPDLPEEEATQGTLPARQSPREADEQEREKANKRE